jgi:hypothetical protein
MPNISYIGILANYCSILLYLYLLTINLIIIRSYSSISIAILLTILLKSLGAAVYYFLNERLNKGFKSRMSLSITSVLTITTLFYNIEL